MPYAAGGRVARVGEFTLAGCALTLIQSLKITLENHDLAAHIDEPRRAFSLQSRLLRARHRRALPPASIHRPHNAARRPDRRISIHTHIPAQFCAMPVRSVDQMHGLPDL